MAAYFAPNLISGSPYLAPDTPDTTIICSVANCVSTGEPAAIQVSSNSVVSCIVGGATANGPDAIVTSGGGIQRGDRISVQIVAQSYTINLI